MLLANLVNVRSKHADLAAKPKAVAIRIPTRLGRRLLTTSESGVQPATPVGGNARKTVNSESKNGGDGAGQGEYARNCFEACFFVGPGSLEVTR